MAVKEFTVQDKLKALHELQSVHSNLDEIEILKGELPMEVNDLEDEIAGLETRMTNIKSEISEFETKISDRQNAIKESQALIARYEGQQENVKNSREFDALTKEIEMQTLEVQLSEKRIRDYSKDADAKKEYKTEAKAAIDAKKKNLEEKKSELEKIIADTDKEEKQLTKKLNAAQKDIEERLKLAFYRIRDSYRNGLAVVTVQRDSCGGCYSKVPPQRQLEIKARKKIIVCEHCGRILVDDMEGEALV